MDKRDRIVLIIIVVFAIALKKAVRPIEKEHIFYMNCLNYLRMGDIIKAQAMLDKLPPQSHYRQELEQKLAIFNGVIIK